MSEISIKQGNTKFDVVVVGSNMIDLLSHIKRLPKMGETVFGDSFHLGFGGKGANQAVMASLLGAKVGMVTKVGDDVFGTMTRDNFAKLGISTDNIFVEEKMSSGVAPIFVDKNGENMIVIIPGANLALSTDEVELAGEMVRSTKLVVSQLEISEEAIVAAFTIAREAGVLTILNPAPATPISKNLIALTDLMIPNETEASLLTGIEINGIHGAENAARILMEQGVKIVLLTLGKDGAYLFAEDKQQHFPAEEVNAIDTTGAGDAFIGSLAYGLSKGMTLSLAIQFANKAAALSVTKIGTQTSFPTLDEIDALDKS